MPEPISSAATVRWKALGNNNTIFAAPAFEATRLALLPADRTVQVLGRTDGVAARAWCRIDWEGAPEAWVYCASLTFLREPMVSVPIIGPAVTSGSDYRPPPTVTPRSTSAARWRIPVPW